MVYDYDPIPPQPEYSRPDPILEDEEYVQQRAQELRSAAPQDAMSEGVSEGSGNPLEEMADVGKSFSICFKIGFWKAGEAWDLKSNIWKV